MAPSRLALAPLLLLLLATYLAESRDVLQSEGSLIDKSAAMDCAGACKVRCSLSSRPNLCQRACGTCCARCNCVPPGTYGNYDVCPCYGTMTTRGDAHKCP